MNIYLQELKSLRKSALIWVSSMSLLALLFLTIYPAMAEDAEDFKELLANYPETVRAMLGIHLDYITSLVGFYSMIFSFILLCGAIQAMNLGVSILSKEARERTADFLLVKPVSRNKIVTAKLSAAFTIIVITDLLFFGFTMVLAEIVKTSDYNSKQFFMINLTIFFIQLIFMSIGMAVSVFFNKIKSVIPISLGFVFGFYMIGALLSTGKNDALIRFLSPFKYFDTVYIIQNTSYELSYLLLGVIIVAAGIITSYIVYKNKDIHAVS